MNRDRFEEARIHAPDGQAMCGLISGDRGWLMYLREPGGAGFSSRNSDYTGPADAVVAYYLANGQRDTYPASWALPVAEVRRALAYFQRERKPPAWVTWHNDSEDGAMIDDPAGRLVRAPL